RAKAEAVYRSFNQRFWYETGNYLYDVVDTESPAEGGAKVDAKCRPNQVLAISLAHPVLARGRWAAGMRTIRDRLVTPVGLRSLAPGDREFKPKYFGDLRARDAAYH